MHHDLAFALRQLRKAPGFTAVALLTLALGIGATTAVFSVVYGVVLRPLPYPDSDRILVVNESRPPTHPEATCSAPTFMDLRNDAKSFAAVAGVRSRSYNLTGSGEPLRCNAEQVSADYFAVFGVAPALGRAFIRDEEEIGRHEVAVLSHGFWQRRLGGDPQIIERTLQLDGHAYRVIGVMPETFARDSRTDLWTPLAFSAGELTPIRRGNHSLDVRARLAPGASLASARAELGQIAARIKRDHPDTNGAAWDIIVQPLRDLTLRPVRGLLGLLFGAVACVLLIVCTNIANLFFARATVQARERAIRSALGASRWHLIRQMLIEAGVLSLAGGAAGVLLAWWGIELLPSLSSEIPRLHEVKLNPAVLAFAFGLSALTSVLCGLVPAWQASRVDLTEALKSGARGSTDARGGRWRQGLVVAEITLAFVLLAGAGAFLASFARLQAESLGLDPQRATIVALALPASHYPGAEARRQFLRRAEASLAGLPGIEHVGATESLPFRSYTGGSFHIEGTPKAENGYEPITLRYVVTPGYLPAMGLRLLRGRFLQPQDDENSPPVVVINETFARAHFADRDPIGQRVELYTTNEPRYREIVGVVADTKLLAIDEQPMPQCYESSLQHPPATNMFFTLRHRADAPAPTAAAIRAAIFAVDANQPISRIQAMETIVASTLARQRFGLQLLATFALLAFVITVVGIYGVTAFDVSRRRNEIGIRLALGATPAQIRQLVLRHGLRLAAAGLGAGLLLMLGVGRVLQAMLYRTQATDPAVLGGLTVTLLGVALLACWLPARRAAKVDPLIALRAE
jgi:putative ABC transport system permease protein